MTTNGRIPDDQLSTVAVGERLLAGTANALRALIAQAAHEHVSIKLAPGRGSAYRDLALQELYYAADHGDKDAQAKTHHVPTPGEVKVAAPGGSSHGWANRVDLLFDGSARPTVVHLNLAKRFGFAREFGSADANHFEHDGKTAIHPPGPVPGSVYIVKQGDTLSEIAEDHGLTLAQIIQLNPGRIAENPGHIEPGWKVRIR